MDLVSSIFLSKNPVCLAHSDTTWYHHKPNGQKYGILTQKYRADKVCFYQVHLPCLVMFEGINHRKINVIN